MTGHRVARAEPRHDGGEALRRTDHLAVHPGDDRSGRQARGGGRAVADRADDQRAQFTEAIVDGTDRSASLVSNSGRPVASAVPVPEPVTEPAEAVVLLLLLRGLVLPVAARPLGDVYPDERRVRTTMVELAWPAAIWWATDKAVLIRTAKPDAACCPGNSRCCPRFDADTRPAESISGPPESPAHDVGVRLDHPVQRLRPDRPAADRWP